MKPKDPVAELLKGVLVASGRQDKISPVMQAYYADQEQEAKAETYLKTKVTASMLDLHPKSILRYGREGILHPVRRSARCLRWKKSEVEKLMRDGAEKAEAT